MPWGSDHAVGTPTLDLAWGLVLQPRRPMPSIRRQVDARQPVAHDWRKPPHRGGDGSEPQDFLPDDRAWGFAFPEGHRHPMAIICISALVWIISR